jgi:two-component system, LuxR family, response regulator FixJ
MNSGAPIVYIVEDDRISRALVEALTQAIGIPCKSFDSAKRFLQEYDAQQPGCVVLDVFMPDFTGIELQQALNLRGATIPLIFVTGHGDVPTAVEAMRCGAFNYLLKPFRNSELIDNVRRALETDRQRREELKQAHAIADRIRSLTPREREVLDYVAHGHANRVIADKLGLSSRTVELHRARGMEKMAAGSVAQLVRMLTDFEQRSHRL